MKKRMEACKMKSVKRGLMIFALVCTIVCCSVMVSANISPLTVSAGHTKFTDADDYSQIVGGNHTYGYAEMYGFKFNGGVPDNTMPTGCHIYVMLYTYNPGSVVMYAATNDAALTGQYSGVSPQYDSGYGNVGSKYRMRTHSDYSEGYTATFYWFA